ncbi:hypothetical protein LTS07_006727 [Exophiala sideris]|nr:hypothetical protein LTS07_006727 [Exophiala sideris]KAK5037559.1 hypothetical protein LTR13_004717 [Exophiala sideris]
MATPVKLCDTEPGFSFSFEHYIQTPPETTPSMFRFNSDESLKTISVRDMSEESSSDSIARVRQEDEYQTMSKKEEASAFARFGHDLSMDEVVARADEEKAVGLGDWGQLYEYETASMSNSKETSSTAVTADHDNIREEDSGSQTMIDATLDDVLYRFLTLSKEVASKTSDEYLISHASKEAELLLDDLVKQGFDETKLHVLDRETSATVNCRIMQSRQMARLKWLQDCLATIRDEVGSFVEEVKDTAIHRSTTKEERERQNALVKKISSELGKLAREWQDVVEGDAQCGQWCDAADQVRTSRRAHGEDGHARRTHKT